MDLSLAMIHCIYNSGGCTEEEFEQLLENYNRRQEYIRKGYKKSSSSSWEVPSGLKPGDKEWGPYFGDFAED